MFVLIAFRPEAYEEVDHPNHFEGLEVLGLFEESQINREIDYWKKHGGKNWKFHYENAVSPVEEWCWQARQSGMHAAQNAATWVTDGNDSDESRRHKLKLIDEGDPLMDQYLPARPSLSGEWNTDITPAKLIEEVTGRQPEDVPNEDRESILNAWENAVNDHFVQACEAELRKAMS